MEPECMFRNDQGEYFQAFRGKGEKFIPEPCPYVVFEHFRTRAVNASREASALDFTQSSDNIKMKSGYFDDADVLIWPTNSRDTEVCSRLHLLYATFSLLHILHALLISWNSLTPPRRRVVDQNGRIMGPNVEAPIPFSRQTFDYMVESFRFHKGFFKKERHGQIAKTTRGSYSKSKSRLFP